MFNQETSTPTDVFQQIVDEALNPKGKVTQMLKIPVIKGQKLREDIEVIVGSIPIKHLLDRQEIPYLDALRNVGYQRKPAMSRVKALANELREGHADIPTSILINIRDENFSSYLVRDGNQLFLEIPLESDIKFYIVDGQHRSLAFGILYEEDFERWGDYQIQFVAMLGANKDQEMKQFYTVNSTAKSVKTDLAYNILNTLSDSDQHIQKKLIESGQTWKVKGQKIADGLYKNSEVWRNKIRLANADKVNTVLPVASLVNSLSLPLKNTFFSNRTLDDQLAILEAYWGGIKIAAPEAFGDFYKDYALQKGLGVSVMHELMPEVIEVVRNRGEDFDVKSAEKFAEIVEPMLTGLQATVADDKIVSGSEFWLSGKKGGAAGAFSSSAGKKLLVAKLKANMPKLTF